MRPYVTPATFARMGTGADLSGVTDDEIARVLDLATAEVNRWCSVPTRPVPHDFRGGRVVGEQHVWEVGNDYRAGSDRVYLWHQPVVSLSRFFLRVTSDQGVTFDPADCYLNASEGYLEVISLARRLSVFSAGFVPILGLRAPVAELDYAYGWTLPEIDDTCYPTATASGEYSAPHQWWTDDPVTVTVDGAPTADVTLDRDEGTLTFGTPPLATARVAASYCHRLPGEIAQATALAAANALAARSLTASGAPGLQGIHVEEVELRFSRTASPMTSVIDGRIERLLAAHKYLTFT